MRDALLYFSLVTLASCMVLVLSVAGCVGEDRGQRLSDLEKNSATMDQRLKAQGVLLGNAYTQIAGLKAQVGGSTPTPVR